METLSASVTTSANAPTSAKAPDVAPAATAVAATKPGLGHLIMLELDRDRKLYIEGVLSRYRYGDRSARSCEGRV